MAPIDRGACLKHVPYGTRLRPPDEEVFRHAQAEERIIISCNGAHFLALAEEAVAAQQSFPGLIVLIRCRSRQAECAYLLQLLRRAGETGVANNINFA